MRLRVKSKNFKTQQDIWLDSSLNKITFFKWGSNQPGSKAKYACSHRGTGKWLATDGTSRLDVFCVLDKTNDSMKFLNESNTESGNSTSASVKQQFNGAQLKSINRFVNQTAERLQNFDRILDLKIRNFNNLTSSVEFTRRMLFLLPDVDNIDAYIERKIEDKKREEQLRTAKLVIKMIAALVMSLSFVLIAKTTKQILKTKIKRFDLAKRKKEKAKQKNMKKRISVLTDAEET